MLLVVTVVLFLLACGGQFLGDGPSPSVETFSSPHLLRPVTGPIHPLLPLPQRPSVVRVPLPVLHSAEEGNEEGDQSDWSAADGSDAPSNDVESAEEGMRETDGHEFPTEGMESAEDDDEDVAGVAVLNQQSECEVDNLKIVSQLESIRSLLGADGFGVTLVLVSDKKSRSLNKQFRKVDAPTDILSFPFLPRGLRRGTLPTNLPPPLRSLGDLVVCVPYVLRQCARDAQAAQEATKTEADPETEPLLGVARLMTSGYFTFEERLPLLIIHGMLHLLGYDHETDTDYEEMARRELELLAAFQKRDG